MKLDKLSLYKSLNPAYRKQSLKRDQIEAFKTNLAILFSRVDENETEENLKNIVSDFLKDTYYKGIHEVNTKDRKDLVIHNEKTAASKVGVIIEVKRPNNKSEMITMDKPNSKALHELLHYYMQERFIKDNKEIKHLIITNIFEWFIFDASEFEKFFFENKPLRKNYEDWNRGALVGKNTDWFYQEVAKPFIDKELTQLTCSHFNIKEIQKFLDKPEGKDEKKLIDFYKILSAEHLLKKPFANDSNSLNKDFYNELLHIIGLEETKDKDSTKKLIKRKQEGKQDEGSLLENTINILKVRNKLAAFENLKHFGDTESEQLFSIALELCITWLNRILFLKLLEGQLIKYHKGDKTFSFLNFNRITDFDEINELFFEVLAVPSASRSKSVKDKFGNLPYLNSSLFEESELESKTLVIGDLKDRLEIPIINLTVLKEQNGKRITGKKNSLQYLFDFLDAYDFSSDSTAEIQEQNKTIINASVLGLIFEKINGYKDGSFFTPGFVTMYMCRQTIRKTVLQKFNEQYEWTCKDFNDLYNKLDKITLEQANNTVNSLKICDPAVGSGHFLVSALNEIISIKSELEILCDKNWKRLRGYKIITDNDELIIAHEEDIFQYNYKDPDSQRIQKTLFHEKENIIENCLFGVDINPKSVMICRLRLWIELLKNAYYKEKSDIELETLPNIDINIKCGNSLISRFNVADTYSKLPSVTQQKIKLATKKYKDQVFLYKSTTDKATKKLAEKNIADLKATFSGITNPNDSDYRKWKEKESQLLKKQSELPFGDEKEKKQWSEAINYLSNESLALKEKYELKLKTLYANAFEWRFEFPEVLDEEGNFHGFDIIIGNPPYFSLSKDERNSFYKSSYLTFNTAGDIYCLFYELAERILSANGNLTFITSNKWMRATYGKELREYLLQRTNPYFVFDFSWFQVFENASVDTNILCFQKANYTSTLQGASAQKDFKLETLATSATQNLTTLNVSGSDYWNVAPAINQNLKTKIEARGKKFEDWNFQVNYGIKSGFNDAFQIDTETRNALIKKDKRNSEILMPLLRGRDIERYGYKFADIYLINAYNGFQVTIKNAEKNIVKETDGTFTYKHEDSEEWFSAKRIEHSRGNHYRINRVIVETDYPSIFEHMKKFETELKKREDQGNHWTNLRNCAYDDQFKTDKLVWAETMRVHKTGNRNFPRFGFDNEKHYTDKTVFIGVGAHLKYLLALLNSSVGKWMIMEYVGKLDTGGYMMQKVFLDKIPIVEPDEIAETKIEKLIDEILTVTKQSPNDSSINEKEKEIEKTLYELYNLTEEEIKIVEAA